MKEIAYNIVKIVSKDLYSLNEEEKSSFISLFVQMQTLVEIEALSKPLVPHLQNAFKQGVVCTYLN